MWEGLQMAGGNGSVYAVAQIAKAESNSNNFELCDGGLRQVVPMAAPFAAIDKDAGHALATSCHQLQ